MDLRTVLDTHDLIDQTLVRQLSAHGRNPVYASAEDDHRVDLG